jgi:hypothetical protein
MIITILATLTLAISPSYPRIAMLWSPYDGAGEMWEKAQKYSIVLTDSGSAGFEWQSNKFSSLATSMVPSTLPVGRAKLAAFQAKSSAAVLFESYYFEANEKNYPPESSWWARDAKGNKTQFWPGCYNMDVSNPAYLNHILTRIKAEHDAAGGKTGLFIDNLRFEPAEKKAWITLLTQLRKDRPNIQIMVNSGWASDDLAWIAPHINGVMYEDSIHHTNDKNEENFYARVATFDKLMRKPNLSTVEIFGKRTDAKSAERELIRTLVYTDAAFLFSDDTNAHAHDWRAEWSAKLGAPKSPALTPNGSFKVRRFEKGFVMWNPTSQPHREHYQGILYHVLKKTSTPQISLNPGEGGIYEYR